MMDVSFWTLENVLEKRVRLVYQNASGGSYVAIITVRFEPAPEAEGVLFASTVGAFAPYVEAVAEGIQAAIQEQSEKRMRIREIKAVLVELVEHPIDAKDYGFRKAGYQAVMEGLCAENVLKRRLA